MQPQVFQHMGSLANLELQVAKHGRLVIDLFAQSLQTYASRGLLVEPRLYDRPVE